jgi:SNF2 family DNA or RNA helicase
MSEWKAGSDSDDDAPIIAATKKRPTKGERQRLDDDSEYSAAAESSKHRGSKRNSGPNSPSASADEADGEDGAVYEAVKRFLRQKETAHASKEDAAPSTDPGHGVTPDVLTQPALLTGAKMHPHQMSALNFIKSRFELGLSLILADEMGLGKTLSSISFLAYLQDIAAASASQKNSKPNSASSAAASPRVGPFLVICPLTVLENWHNELSNFAPSLLVQSYTGTRPEREEIQDDIKACIMEQPKLERKDPVYPFHVLLTTYECVINDCEFLSKIKWRVGIVDESHRLKNSESALSQTLISDYRIAFKLLLTGTPLQNNLGELHSLLWFLQPSVFRSKKAFVKEFEVLGNQHSPQLKAHLASMSEAARELFLQEKLDHLHEILRPFMLRRLKEECELNIPPKREIILKTPLSASQKSIYKNLLLKNFDLIGAAGGKAQNSRALLNVVQSLRKCSTHPYLFPGVEPEPFEEGPHIYQASGKFKLLAKLLRTLKKQGRRVLLFSTSVQTLDIVQDTLSFLGYTYERLDGSVRGEERFLAIERFTKQGNTVEETFVFLLSTRAGGVGLNLTVADTVIFLDSDWNPQMV